MSTSTDTAVSAVSDVIPDSVRRLARKEILNEQIDALIEVIASEGFLGFVNDIAALPTHDQRRRFTAEHATLDTLRERGVATPAGMRFTTREFERPEDGREADSSIMKLDPALDPRMGWCASLGYIFCVSYGN